MVNYATFECATTSRSRCRVCGEAIHVGEVRLRLGWDRGAQYYHPACAVEEHAYRLLEAAALPGAPPLSDELKACIAETRAKVRAKAEAELAAERAKPRRPVAERIGSAQRCIQCQHAIEKGGIAIVDDRGHLHPSCVQSWLRSGAVDGYRWERALRENSHSSELNAIRADLGWSE